MPGCAEQASLRTTDAVSPLSSIHSILVHYSTLFGVSLGLLELVFGDVCKQIDEALYTQPLAQLDTNIKFKVRLCRVLGGILDKSTPLTELLPPSGLYDNGNYSRSFTIFCDNYAGAVDIDSSRQLMDMSSAESYLCPSCEKLMLLPVVLHPCGHTVCRSCLELNTVVSEEAVDNDKHLCITVCPICNSEASFAHYSHEIHQKLRNRFTFNCAFFPEGCIFKGLLADMETHIKMCPYALRERDRDEEAVCARLKMVETQLHALEADTALYMDVLKMLQHKSQAFSEGIQSIEFMAQRLVDNIQFPDNSIYAAQLAKIDEDLAADANDPQKIAVKMQIVGDILRTQSFGVPPESRQAPATAATTTASDQTGNIAMINSLENQLSYYKQKLAAAETSMKEMTSQQTALKQELEVQREIANENQRISNELALQLSMARDQLLEKQKSCSCAVVRTCNDELAAENKRLQLSISNLQRALGDSKQETGARNEEMEEYKERLIKLMMDTNELTNTLVKFQMLTAEQNKRLREMSSQLQLFYSGKPVCYDCGCKIESAMLDQNTIVYTTTEFSRQTEQLLAGFTMKSMAVGTSVNLGSEDANAHANAVTDHDGHAAIANAPLNPWAQTPGDEHLQVLTSDHPLSLEHFMEDDINIDITAITLLRYLFHPKTLHGRTKLEHFANECKDLLRTAIDKHLDLTDEKRLAILYQLLAKLRQFYANDYPLDEILNFLTRFQLENSLIMRDQFGVEARRSIMEGYKKVRTENRLLKAKIGYIQEKKSVYHSVLAEQNRRMTHQ